MGLDYYKLIILTRRINLFKYISPDRLSFPGKYNILSFHNAYPFTKLHR
jgi:hypothetical protein